MHQGISIKRIFSGQDNSMSSKKVSASPEARAALDTAQSLTPIADARGVRMNGQLDPLQGGAFTSKAAVNQGMGDGHITVDQFFASGRNGRHSRSKSSAGHASIPQYVACGRQQRSFAHSSLAQ